MRKVKKTVLAIACAGALVIGSVAGTMAYLTSKTDVVTNTFTVGSITATLDETDVDVYGVKDGETRVAANDYKLIPGHTYVKDPTVHIAAGSEPCWLFVKVSNPLSSIESSVDGKSIEDQMAANGWVARGDGIYVWGNGTDAQIIDARESAVDKIVFESLNVADNAAVSGITAGTQITVVACAVQADGLTVDQAASQAVFQ